MVRIVWMVLAEVVNLIGSDSSDNWGSTHIRMRSTSMGSDFKAPFRAFGEEAQGSGYSMFSCRLVGSHSHPSVSRILRAPTMLAHSHASVPRTILRMLQVVLCVLEPIRLSHLLSFPAAENQNPKLRS